MRFFNFLLIYVIAVFPAKAQIGYGPEIGIGVSRMYFAPPIYPIDYTEASTGAIASGKIGGLIDFPLNKHFYVQAGISFAREGVTRSFSYYFSDSFNESVNQTLYLNYFQVPVSLIFKTGVQGKGRFIFGVGASPAYLIGGRNKLQDNQVFKGVTGDTTSNTLVVSALNRFDIGVSLTAGYELRGGLFLRAYYTDGVNDLSLNTEIDKNRMWGIAAGYIFGKGRNANKDDEGLIDKTTDQ